MNKLSREDMHDRIILLAGLTKGTRLTISYFDRLQLAELLAFCEKNRIEESKDAERSHE